MDRRAFLVATASVFLAGHLPQSVCAATNTPPSHGTLLKPVTGGPMLEEKTFNTGTVSLAYTVAGAELAAPLLMLHGGAWSRMEFLSLIPALSRKRCIYALDSRGCGNSGWTPGHYKLSNFTEDIIAFLDHLPTTAIILGHSIGGVVALMAAKARPDKVKALIIEDAPLEISAYRKLVEGSHDMFTTWLAAKQNSRTEPELALALADTFQGYPGVTSPWILFFANCLWRLDPTYFDHLLKDFDSFVYGYAPWVTLRQFNRPALFLRGENRLGAVMTDEEVAKALQICSKARYKEIVGVGHLLHLQDVGQDPVLAALNDFLDTSISTSDISGAFQG
jgi:pimeloyl-ACP methyl ester carboxylesterase